MPSSEYYKNTVEMLNEQARHRVIIDFISSHQGCTAEDIVKENKLSGRGKTFKILKELKNDCVVREENSDTNRRDKKLFINENNPLVSFPEEIKEFKRNLYELFHRAQYYRKGSKYNNVVYPNDDVLYNSYSLFFEYLNINNYRAFVIWPDTVKDKETLSKLYMLLYSEMIKINLEIREKFQPVEFSYLDWKKTIAKGMDREEYLMIAKNAALAAIAPDTLHFEKLQDTFQNYKLNDASYSIVLFLKELRENIYNSQTMKPARKQMRNFRNSNSNMS
jgi:hypothetical protein